MPKTEHFNDDGTVVERVTPSDLVQRRLFAHSGNLCAFPGCTQLMISATGIRIGYICHIEAASHGGQRFNSAMSNEERSQFENLVLLCDPHHTETNDIDVWTVERMREMKTEHEARFAHPEHAFDSQFVDYAKSAEAVLAKTLARLVTVLEWSAPDADEIALFSELALRLQKVSRAARRVLCIVIDESRDSGNVSAAVIENRLRKGAPEGPRAFFDVLAHHKLLQIDIQDDGDGRPEFTFLRALGVREDQPALEAIARFCESTGVELEQILVDLRFNLLDAE